MKSTLLAKLELLAAADEAKRAEALRRAQAALAQAQAQQNVLEAYRARLAASVQDGGVVSAAQIRAAGLFAEAGLTALAQVAQSQARTASAIEAEGDALRGAQAKRRKLQDALHATRRQDDLAAEARAERLFSPPAMRQKEA
ncbi:MAG TPA: hypothetical protein VMH92_11130 [Acidocella sp.]|nr:hypothetical protein [Acidocella sp.]